MGQAVVFVFGVGVGYFRLVRNGIPIIVDIVTEIDLIVGVDSTGE